MLLLGICTCTYVRELRPGIFDPHPSVRRPGLSPPSSFCAIVSPHTVPPTPRIQSSDGAPLKREGLLGFLWKLSRIGERLSPYVGLGCALMAVHVLFFR